MQLGPMTRQPTDRTLSSRTISFFSPSLPVIAVENASRDDERRVFATVADLAANPDRLGLKSPAVLIFGEVAGLPAHGPVEDILALEEVKRLYA